jgi:phosphate/sulfate permease
MAWNIGANDVSNAMGTSVGSKALTLKKAVIIAAVLEFSGAFFLGSNVSKTIQSGIVNTEFFHSDPSIYALGMIASLLATGIWLHTASYLRVPVSTTHAIVGAIAGFGLMSKGVNALHWMKILFILSSWIFSPLLSGAIAYLLFSLFQKKILFNIKPLEATKNFIPYLVFLVFNFFTLSLIYNGLINLNLNLPFLNAFMISSLIGIIASLISFFLVKKIPTNPHLAKRSINPLQIIALEKAAKHLQRTQLSSSGKIEERAKKILNDVKELSNSVKEEPEYLQTTTDYEKIEKTFVYLQILSASMIAFAHGANDVSNAIGPVAAVMSNLKANVVTLNTTIPLWILILGGGGIVIGLATWGWRVIETVGKKITELTPTRGFCAEFSAALTILLASKLGLPISTTHALIGGILGVGFARGLSALNLKTLRDIAFSWIITIPICMLLSIILFYIIKSIVI